VSTESIAPAGHRRPRRRSGSSGQSIVEFAFVVPILLMVFIAIADFGRIFAASITVEAATRNAAEAAANQYLAVQPGPLQLPAPAGVPAYYNALHDYAAGVVCAELRDLPGINYDSGTNTCPDMPFVLVCVHDGQDTACATEASPGSTPVPAACGTFSPAPTHSQAGGQPGARWVEVRTCYHFQAILHVPLFSLGDFWLERSRSFAIPCYFVIGTPVECG
jgi:hypothetical protein